MIPKTRSFTAITSTINDSLSREVVGVPLCAKNYEQLIAIDEKNAESKNPIKKALAYSIGKKNVAKAMLNAKQSSSQKQSNLVQDDLGYFFNDFFIKPEIS